LEYLPLTAGAYGKGHKKKNPVLLQGFGKTEEKTLSKVKLQSCWDEYSIKAATANQPSQKNFL
jgi:hypothetical protein